MKQTLLYLFFTFMLFSGQVDAQDFISEDLVDILPVNEAFRFEYVGSVKSISLFWHIKPGYFLYHDKISVSVNGVPEEIELPKGEWFLDETFGLVQVLGGLVSTIIPDTNEKVSVHYQGCAEKGYCYPPQIKHLNSENPRTNSIKLKSEALGKPFPLEDVYLKENAIAE